MQIDRRSLLLVSSGAFVATTTAPVAARAAVARSPESSTVPDGDLPAGVTSHVAAINGIRMHYLAAGAGPLLVLLHGWPQTSFAWHGVMPRLATRFRVIAPDLRGTGLSERTADGYDKRTIAEDIAGLIAHAGNGTAYVVGHDMGGKAAYVLAHRAPALVGRLVLVDCLLPGTENMDALRGGAWHYGFHMAVGVPEMLTAGRERDYIRSQIKAWSFRKDAISEAAITEYARHYAGPGGMTAGFNYYRALRDDAPFVATFRGQALSMPVMTITGRASAAGKLADALRPEAPELISVIADDCGHFVAEEVPDLFCERLEDFLPRG